jgi:peroxiredoxin
MLLEVIRFMRRIHRSVPALLRAGLITLLCLVAMPYAAAAGPALAADFALKADNGRNLRLRELRGQVVMINFWATWCGPCREEMPKLDQLYRQYQKTGFTLLGVNIDDNPANALSMAKKLGVTFPVLFDRDKQASKLYKVDAMPSTVLIDRDGKLRYLHRGYKPGYEATYQTEIRELLKE